MKKTKTGLLTSILLASALTLAANGRLPSDGWNVTDHIALKDFVIQAHRGAGDLAEEGTLEAFKIGWSLGTIPEADVRATKDGVIVTFHDNNFKRILPNADDALKKSSVEKQTWKFIQTLDVGAWKGPEFAGRRVAKMSDIFAYMKGRPGLSLYIDVKKVDFAKLAAEVHAAGVGERVILASRNPAHLVEWKKLAPESGTLLWLPTGEQEINKLFDELVASGDIKSITSVQLHVHPNRLAPNYNKDTDGGLGWKTIPCTTDPAEPFNHTRAFIAKFGERLRGLGILYEAFAYSKDDSFYAPLLDLGVAALAGDHPDIAVREVKAYYARRAAKK
ncbi:MAG: hypothetical protein LBM92_04880 [Opitutaceae bacterium]|nr:hypothetical protein [Opitutaceae bacterium]